MRVPEWETKPVPSALNQNFRLKINIAAYGEASCYAIYEIMSSAESTQDFLHFYVYIEDHFFSRFSSCSAL